MKTSFITYTLIFTGVFLLFAGSCKKDDEIKDDQNTSLPVLTTTAVSDIKQSSATSGGNITSDGGSAIIARGVCWSIGDNPTISDNKTTDSTGVGVFSSFLDGLSPDTHYYLRAYATNSIGTGYGNTISFTTDSLFFTDSRDGNVYKIVEIGTQVWMAENLKYLPEVVGPATGSSTSPHYYVFGYSGNDVVEAKASQIYSIYGVLYNWSAAVGSQGSSKGSNVQGVCPDGWHLPDDYEWEQLIDYLGGKDVAGGKLKESGYWHWNMPNAGATNESGFSARAGGRRNMGGNMFFLNQFGFWWAANETTDNRGRSISMSSDSSNVVNNVTSKEMGFSVRCIRD